MTKQLQWPEGLRKIAQDLMYDIELASQSRRIADAKADPEAHKLSTDFPDGLRWRYVRAGKDGRGRQVRFCFSTTRNASGYYLGWREVRSATGGKRDQWTASKTRRIVRDRAIKRSESWKQRRT